MKRPPVPVPVALRRIRGQLARRTSVFAIVLALLAGNGLVWNATRVAFSANTQNPGNTVSVGTVTLTDNDGSDTQTLFNVSNLIPGDTNTSCITVTYTGSLPAMVALYASTTGTGLASYLNLTVTRGTISSGSFGDCTNFTPDATNYTGAGAGVIYNSTLAAFPSTFATGVVDPTAAAQENWTTGEAHSYKFQTVNQDNNGGMGKSATTAFTWQVANNTTYPLAVLGDNPASYWSFDETSGTTAVDRKGVANATYSGPTLGVVSAPKTAGTSISFQDLNADIITAGNVYSFSDFAPFSVECWIKPSANNGIYRRIIEKPSAWMLWMSPDVNEGLVFQRDYTDAVTYLSAPISSASWHHVVMSFDGATSKLYLDGVQVDSQATATPIPNYADPLTIGEANPGAAEGYGGGLDELAIYAYGLSAAQVAAHYMAGR